MKFTLVSAALFLSFLLKNTNADVCDWSGYNDWARGWDVTCSSDIKDVDYASFAGCVVLDFLGGGGSCTTTWISNKLQEIGLEVGGEVIQDLIDGKIEVVNGVDVKAAVHTGTGCKHCPLSWLCIPKPNRHRVCVAHRPNKSAPEPSKPVHALRSYHGGCDSVHKSRDPVCVAATSRYCAEKCNCGGVSQQVGAGVFGVGCFKEHESIVKLAELQEHHPVCNRISLSQSNECYSAVHRWCEATGRGQVGIAQEVGADEFLVACTDATWYGDVSIQDLRRLHGGCNEVGKGQTADCVAAINTWCNRNGKGTLGLAQELGNGVIGAGCFNAEWYGDIAV